MEGLDEEKFEKKRDVMRNARGANVGKQGQKEVAIPEFNPSLGIRENVIMISIFQVHLNVIQKYFYYQFPSQLFF